MRGFYFLPTPNYFFNGSNNFSKVNADIENKFSICI